MFKLGFFKKEFVSISIVSCIIVQLLLSFQGFDFCDEGFSLTFYQQFFNAPETVQYNFVYWLSGLFGGIWYQIFPKGGILWFRILAIIVNTGTLLLAYNSLKKFGNSYAIMLGLLMVLFINDFGYIVFYHNTLTAFIVVLASIFLLKGLFKNKPVFLLISGIIIGINVFTRLTNLSMFIFIVVIALNEYLNGLNTMKLVHRIVIFFLGTILGFLIVYFVLYLLNQDDIMYDAIVGILQSGNDVNSEHNIGKVLFVYIKNGKEILIALVKLILGFCILISIQKFITKNKLLLFFWIVIGSLFFYWFFKFKTIYAVYALIISLIGLGFFKTTNKQLKIVYFLAISIAFCLPLGSDMGIWNAGFMSIWLALPLALLAFSNLVIKESKSLINYLGHQKSPVYLLSVIGIGFFTNKFYNISQQAYFDFGSRFEKTYTINSDLAKGILTTKERSEIINTLLPKLKQYVKPNDYLLAYESLPMIHFLTETKPYMRNPWILIYDDKSFQDQLDLAVKENKELPIILQQKFKTIFKLTEPSENYLSEDQPEDERYRHARKRAIKRFIEDNDYKIIWSNSHFNIYKVK